ncbi:MAG: hypothetical protein K0S88_3308 [Actinomycetia bacterium]|nr:hypothetical protein [Actinomycetes bacterium]
MPRAPGSRPRPTKWLWLPLEEAGPAAVRPGRGQGLGGVVGRDQQQGGEQLVAADPPAGLVAEAGAVDPLGGLRDPQDLAGPVGVVGHDGGEDLGGGGDQHRPVGLALPQHGAGGRVHDHGGPRLHPGRGWSRGGRDRHPSHDQGERQEQGGQPPLAGAHAGRLPEPVEETQHPRPKREGGTRTAAGGDRRRRRVIAGSSAPALRPTRGSGCEGPGSPALRPVSAGPCGDMFKDGTTSSRPPMRFVV